MVEFGIIQLLSHQKTDRRNFSEIHFLSYLYILHKQSHKILKASPRINLFISLATCSTLRFVLFAFPLLLLRLLLLQHQHLSAWGDELLNCKVPKSFNLKEIIMFCVDFRFYFPKIDLFEFWTVARNLGFEKYFLQKILLPYFSPFDLR